MQKSTFVFIAVLLAIANVSAFKLKQATQIDCQRVHYDSNGIQQAIQSLQQQLQQVAPLNNSTQQQSGQQLISVKDLLNQAQGDSCDYYFKFNLGLVFDETCKRYLALAQAYTADPAKVIAQSCSQVSFNEPLLQNRRLSHSAEERSLACFFSQLLEQLNVFETSVADLIKLNCPAQNKLVQQSQEPQVNCLRVNTDVQTVEEVVHNIQGFLNQAAPVQSQARLFVQSRKLRQNYKINQFIKQQQDQTCDYYYQFKLGTVFDETCAKFKQLEGKIQHDAAEVLANACNQVSFNEPALQGREVPAQGELKNNVCLAASVLDLYKVFVDSVKAFQAQRCPKQ